MAPSQSKKQSRTVRKDVKARFAKKLNKSLTKSSAAKGPAVDEKFVAWHNKPRIHPSHLRKPERVAELITIFRSDERLLFFTELAATYVEEPSIENYLELRRRVPEADLDVAAFGGMDVVYALESELEKHQIDPDLVTGALDAYEPALDELSLRLMECIVSREKLPKSGPGHIEMRRKAIGDALVDYLIVVMLEAMEWNKSNPIVIPPSLIVLIRYRLCGANPDWLQYQRTRQEQENAAFLAAQFFKAGEKISSRQFADRVGISRSTAMRWLADPSFVKLLDGARKIVASESFQRQRVALIVAKNTSPDDRLSAPMLADIAGIDLEFATQLVADPDFQEQMSLARKLLAIKRR